MSTLKTNNLEVVTGSTITSNANLTLASGKTLTGAAGSITVPGMIIQTVQTVSRSSVSSTSSSYVEASTNFRASITPIYSDSKLLITATIGLTAYNNSGNDCTAWAKLYDVTNTADIANSTSPSRAIDYGNSGTMYSAAHPMILLQDFPNANQITITWYYKIATGVSVLANDDYRTTQIMLQEVAQ